MEEKKSLKFLKNYLISLSILLILALLIYLLLYKFDLSYHNTSNALFIVNILAFIMSIGINFGATRIFNPLKYMMRKVVSPKKTKEEFEDYAGYLEEKGKDNKPVWYLTLASITLLVLAYIFTFL